MKQKMDDLINKIKNHRCSVSELQVNKENLEKGHGKLLPFFTDGYKNKVMLLGLNPSYRRFPGIYQAFGGEVKHKGTGYDFIQLLKDLKLLDSVYITNLIKCSCKDNEPVRKIYDEHYSLFLEEIEIVKPKKIIALGKNVFHYLEIRFYKGKFEYVPHPVYWSAYHKMTKKAYSRLLWSKINT